MPGTWRNTQFVGKRPAHRFHHFSVNSIFISCILLQKRIFIWKVKKQQEQIPWKLYPLSFDPKRKSWKIFLLVESCIFLVFFSVGLKLRFWDLWDERMSKFKIIFYTFRNYFLFWFDPRQFFVIRILRSEI